jgi:hypothetical protein
MNRDELMNELQEQARLVGMGAERELALKAQVQRLERVNVELLEALEAMLSYTAELDPLQGFDWHDHLAVSQARAAIAKARGEK